MMRWTKALGLAAAVLGLVAGSAGRAGAALVVYTDRAAFEAATAAMQTIDFEDFGLGPNDAIYEDNSLTTSGVTFTDAHERLFLLGGEYYGPAATGAYLNENDDFAPNNPIPVYIDAAL